MFTAYDGGDDGSDMQVEAQETTTVLIEQQASWHKASRLILSHNQSDSRLTSPRLSDIAVAWVFS